MSRKKRFDLFIIGGFSFLILLIVALALLGATALENSRTLFRQTYQSSFQTWMETERANADLMSMHSAMKDVALSRNDDQLEDALAVVDNYDLSIKDYFSMMKAADPNNAALLEVLAAYNDWTPIRNWTIDFAKNGRYELAAENTRVADYAQVKLISDKMQQLIAQKRAVADNAYAQSEHIAAVYGQYQFWMTILAILLAVAMSVYVRGRLLRYQHEVHEEKEKLQITFDSIGDGVITTDIDRNVVGLNKVAEEFTGWTTAEAFGRSFREVFDITNAYTGERAKDPVEEVLTTDKICLLENHTILTSRDGVKRHIADSAAPIKDEDNETSGVVMIFRDVTERKIAEKLIKESEARFRTIFEQAPIGIALSDPETGHILEMNDRFTEIIGRTAEELKSSDWMSFTHPDDLQRDLDQAKLLNAGEIPGYRMEKRYIRPDASIVWINMSVTLITDQRSESPLHLCMIEDITQQKLAENELKISETRLKRAQIIANVGNWEINLSTRQVWASEQALLIYGIDSPTSILPLQVIQDVVDSGDRPMMDEALQALRDEDKPYDVQFRIHRVNDGVVRVIRSTAVAERSGETVKLIGIIQDITELKNTELALARSNTMLEATLQATADGIEALDADGRFFFYNDQFRKMWGLPDEVTDENSTFNFIMEHLANPNRTLTDIRDLLSRFTQEPYRELTLKDGRTIERYAKPILLDGQETTGYVLSYRDISERKRSEQALLASESTHRAMIANISDTIAIMDENGVTYISPNLEQLFGWSRQEFGGMRPVAFVHAEDIERVRAAYEDLVQAHGLKMTIDFRLRCKDGFYKYIQLTAVNMLRDPNIKGILANFHDISESKKRETEILYLNYHDLLTGLYNRAFFEEECIRLDCDRQLPISVIMGDINGLKLVNDAFGHKEGDKLLMEIARILGASCRKEDILARTGGDEFCILLPQTTEEEARVICKRIYGDCVKYGNKSAKDAFYLSISLGYATKTAIETSIESILTEAEEYMYKQKLLERKSMRSSLLSSIKTTMVEKNHITAEHEERLVTLAKLIGEAMNLSDAQINELELLSTLHDLGKLSIDDQILNKPGTLTEEEWIEIRKHPEVGYRIAQASPELAPIAEYILCHHERWDGAGYPQGLKGEAIPLLSRIVSVVDSYDAMTQDRPYRLAIPRSDAIEEISSNAGSQFDPTVAQIFIEVLRQFGGINSTPALSEPNL